MVTRMEVDMTLEHLESRAVRLHARAWRPGMTASLLAVTVPAYAATAFDPAAWSWNEMLLAGSLALLAVAFVIRLSRREDIRATHASPDLRWWRNAVDAHDGALS